MSSSPWRSGRATTPGPSVVLRPVGRARSRRSARGPGPGHTAAASRPHRNCPVRRRPRRRDAIRSAFNVAWTARSGQRPDRVSPGCWPVDERRGAGGEMLAAIEGEGEVGRDLPAEGSAVQAAGRTPARSRAPVSDSRMGCDRSRAVRSWKIPDARASDGHPAQSARSGPMRRPTQPGPEISGLRSIEAKPDEDTVPCHHDAPPWNESARQSSTAPIPSRGSGCRATDPERGGDSRGSAGESGSDG